MAKKVIGKAMYLEVRRGQQTSQVIVTPPVMNPVTNMRQKMMTLTRNTDPSIQRRSWRFYTSKADPILEDEMQYETALELVIPLFREVTAFLHGFTTGGWKIYKAPLMVEMTTDDLMDISEAKTPAALMRRIMVARKEGGFSESLFNTPELTTSPTSLYAHSSAASL